jgi:hypothetical protein
MIFNGIPFQYGKSGTIKITAEIAHPESVDIRLGI